VSTDNDQSATVQALIDRIEARAYERGKEAGPRLTLPERDALTATATAGGPADVISEHPILRKLRLIAAANPGFGGWCLGCGDARLNWEEIHAYRHEYDAAHQNDAERPQTGQGGVAAPERATGQTGR
jgi:hypothetical protein